MLLNTSHLSHFFNLVVPPLPVGGLCRRFCVSWPEGAASAAVRSTKRLAHPQDSDPEGGTPKMNK